MNYKLPCVECSETGKWHPPGQELKCLACEGKGYIDLQADYLRTDSKNGTPAKKHA